MKTKGTILFAVAAFYFFCSLLLQNVPDARAGTFSDTYQNLKNNYPQTIQQLKDADGTVSDSDIESFVSDLSSELKSKGTLNESNLDNNFYEAALNVMLKPEHEKVVNAALTGFSISWGDILNKRIPEGFQSIKSALRMELLKSSGTPVGGGGGLIQSRAEVPPGAAAKVSREALEEALKKAVETGVVKIDAGFSAGEVALDKEQLARIGTGSRPLLVKVQGVQISVPPGGLNVPEMVEPDIVQVELGARKLDGGEKPSGAALYRVVGDVYEITAVAVHQDGKKTGITEFKAGVTLSLPVPSSYSGPLTDLQIFRYDEAGGRWVLLGGSYDADTGRIDYVTDHFSKYALMEVKKEQSAVVFSDIGGHWAEKDILAMAARGIVRGTGGRAMPEDKVTRAQFSTFLVLLLGISGTGSDLTFEDADRSAWYYQGLSKAYGAGLIRGYGNGLIGPNDLITREQMAVMVVEAVRYSGKAMPAAERMTFSDTGVISPWSSGPVSMAKSLGIVRGFPDNTFRPRQNATRAEALVMLSGLKL